uniref:Uncharacterized protein n=2 Tax=Timema TaxID=61471 RepID=A0A7R9DZ84_9NEOP|nr:unnamed protein product [Timema cristinae]CAD7423303.1 unnamed protein product [Timema monikensis]
MLRELVYMKKMKSSKRGSLHSNSPKLACIEPPEAECWQTQRSVSLEGPCRYLDSIVETSGKHFTLPTRRKLVT